MKIRTPKAIWLVLTARWFHIFLIQLLVSHDVGQRLFPPQVEQLTQSFQQQLAALPANERMGLNLEQFCTVARALITCVYRNTFPSAVST